MKRSVRIIFGAVFALGALAFNTAHAQPVVVTNVPSNSTNFIETPDLVYFTAGEALWRTDGTSSGTIQLKPAGFTQGNQWRFPQFAREHNGLFYFVNANSTQLWRSNGTSSGTILLKSSSANSLRILDVTDNYLFFKASDSATGEEVYRTDGTTTGTILLRDVYPGSGAGYRGVHAAVNNEFFFAGNNSVNGTELWKTDGTSAGTVMVKDIYPGSASGFPTGEDDDFFFSVNGFAFNNRFYFRGDTPLNGMEPWVSDGTAAGTNLLHDVNPGPDNSGPVQYSIDHNGSLYFVIINDFDEGPGDLWKTSGTSASTTRIATLGDEGRHTSYHSFLVYHDKVYFWDRYEHFSDNLWVTDGTSAGTYSFFHLNTVDGGVPFFEVINDYMVFTANAQDIPYHFYRSDGTTEGTKVFAEFRARGIGVYPRDITKVGDLVFYGDHDGLTDQQSGYPHSDEDYYHLFQTDAITAKSMRTLWGVNTRGTDNIERLDEKVVFTTHDAANGTRLWIYDPSATPPVSTSFTLVNAESNKDIRRLLDGASINNPYNVPINIRFNPTARPGSVVFELNGVHTRTESAAPYSLAGDVNGDYAPWQGAAPGKYSLKATAYSQAGGQGTPGESLTINFTIECESEDQGCVPTGEILRELWTGVSGNDVSAIPVNTRPDGIRHVSMFEGPTNAGTNYGARYRGYVVPPATGNYIFWIASNDHSELWLSTNDNAANKIKIASVTGATNPRDWNKYASQKSVSITLTEGVKYYIEALHKQGGGTDNLAVGWQLPNGTLERPIPGNRLSPFQPGYAHAPTVRMTNPPNGSTFTAPADITIEAEASDGDEQTITEVSFWVSVNGQNYRKINEDLAAPYYFVWEDVGEGHYNVYAFATDADGNTAGSAPVSFTVNAGSGCFASGTITRDYWSGVSGDQVSAIPVNSPPTTTSQLTIFEAPGNIGDNYGTRIRGYICPPVTGGYNFWIASNDHSELWLSTDDNPANKRKIAWVTGATNPRQWDKYRSQLSTTTIWLTQGQRYYIEALHKEGVGSDHVAIGWQLPEGTLERPIPGSRLSPFENSSSLSVAMEQTRITTTETSSVYSRIGIYPNPARSGDPELVLSGFEGIDEAIETEVQIMNMTGEIVFSDRISCSGNCSDHAIKVNKQLPSGLYMVQMKTNGIKHAKRLLVK